MSPVLSSAIELFTSSHHRAIPSEKATGLKLGPTETTVYQAKQAVKIHQARCPLKRKEKKKNVSVHRRSRKGGKARNIIKTEALAFRAHSCPRRRLDKERATSPG